MYTTERYHAQISVEEYLENYVDVDTFLGYCKECYNYNNKWCCPSFDFDVEDYWRQYKTLKVTAVKIIFDEEYAGKVFSEEEMIDITNNSLRKVKASLTAELFEEEKKYPGSVSLSAGSCYLCGEKCTKPEGKPCRLPEKLRYSIEALGGNVGLTISKLMGIDIEWAEEGKLPNYFVLVCGILLP